MLVARIVEVLRTGHATIDELVVITFTEKAAAELAARVREGLEDARATTSDADERDRLDAALRGLYRARIETIHAFAASLLRERPVESPVDPGLRVLDERRGERPVLGGLRRLARRAPARRRPDGSSGRCAAASTRPTCAGWPRCCTSIAPRCRACSHRTRHRTPPRFLDAVETAADQLRAELGACTNPDDDRGDRQALRLIEWVESAARAARRPRSRSSAARCSGAPSVAAGAGDKGNWAATTALRRGAKGRRSPWLTRSAIFADALRGEVIAEIVPLVEEFVARYAERRRADGVADFDDLLIWARDLLRNPQVRDYFHRRYRCVLIDEFQDTDPIQAELAMLLDRRRRRRRPRAGPARRRRRSEAVDLPLPPRRHRDLRRGQGRPARRRPDADPAELPLGRGRARLGQPRLRPTRSARASAASQPPHVPLLAARSEPAGTARAGGRRPR